MANVMARTMNAVMPRLLRSRWHGLASGWCMLVSVTGRKTGRVYTTPVYYRRVGAELRFFSGREVQWVKNVASGAPVTVRLRGEDLAAWGELRAVDERLLRGMFGGGVRPETMVMVVVTPGGAEELGNLVDASRGEKPL